MKVGEDMKNENIVRKINPSLVQDDGRLKSFAEQLLEYEYGVYPKDKPFVISNITMRLNDAQVMPYPIVISQSTVEHIKKKHDIRNTSIMKIERMLQNNVLVLESRKHRDSLVVVTDCIDEEDRPIVIIMRKGFMTADMMTNKISSMYSKRSIEDFLDASFRDGCQFYPNEKTEHWLTSQRLQLPPDVVTALSYHYNIPDALFCQAENFYQRGNRGEKYHSLENQINYAKTKKKKKKSSSFTERTQKGEKYNEKVR